MFKKLVRNLISSSETKMVLIVRTDLKMSAGKMAAQCAHASVTLYQAAQKSQNDYLAYWLQCGQPKIVLRCDTSGTTALQQMYQDAKSRGLNACLIYDAGATQVKSGTLTVLGIGPNLREDVDRITGNLKLL